MAIQSSGEYQDRGLELLLAGSAAEALAVFEEGARKFPGDAELNLGRALTLNRLGEFVRASEILEGLRGASTQTEDVLTGLVEAYLGRGMTAQAKAAAGEAAAGPAKRDAETLCRLGRAFYVRKRYGDALPFYERAAELAPKWGEAWFGLGACQWALCRPAWAEAALRRAVELEPSDWQARQFLGCVLHDLGRRKDAREMLEAVPLDVSWQKPALERMVAMAWWPQDPEKRRRMESLWRSVVGGTPGRGAMDMLEEVSRKMGA
ncbi:MAG: tetratricopeptide repeat protein [Elusimicrobia bacterium]|nr:tetratricopeptide repeat protein [Elusimicrobiota bacterium]